MFQFIDKLYDAYYNFRYRFFEQPRGLDFMRKHYPNYGAGYVHYQTASMRLVRKMFKKYMLVDAPMLDVGCGKGYFIYCVRRLGFKYVDGVECDSHLARIARQNFDALGMEGVQIANMDASHFNHLDNYRIIHLFNPFTGFVMKGFLENLEYSLEMNPRTLLVVYHNPVEHQMWDRSPMFEQVDKRRLPWLYRRVPVLYYVHRNPSTAPTSPPAR